MAPCRAGVTAKGAWRAGIGCETVAQSGCLSGRGQTAPALKSTHQCGSGRAGGAHGCAAYSALLRGKFDAQVASWPMS